MQDLDNRKLILIAIVFTMVLNLPFLNKPITIDDPVVLEVAEQIVKEPLRPYSCWINWLGDFLPMFDTTTNPPLTSYFLAPFLAIWGYNEIALHTGMLVFPLMIALGMVALSRRFTGGSIWPVLLVITSPALSVSNNTMRDVPGTAFIVAAVACFVYGCDRDSRKLLFWGSFFAGCALLVKYSQLIVFFVFIAYALLNRKPRHLLWLLVPLAMLGVWFGQNILVHGETHFGYLARVRRNDTSFTWIEKLRCATTILGSLLLLWPVALVHDIRFKRWIRLTICAIVLVLGLLGIRWQFGDREAGFEYYLWAGAGIWLGTWAILTGITAICRSPYSSPLPFNAAVQHRRDGLFLFIWMLIHAGVASFGVFFQAVRHVLPIFPALSLLAVLAFRYEAGERMRSVLRPVLAFCVVVQLVLAIAINIADYEFADPPRRFVAEELPRLQESGREIWYHGSWGWRTYARNAGMINVAGNGPTPPAGALYVRFRYTYKGRYPDGFQESRLRLLEEHEYPGWMPIRTMRDRGFFYSTMGTSTPFRFSTVVQDVAEVYEVLPSTHGQ